MIVLDASVMAKLYRDEAGSDAAASLVAAHAGELIAPDVFAVEVAGVIVRDANSDKQGAALQHDKLAHFTAFLRGAGIVLERAGADAIMAAASLAMRLGHPVKDCLYLALAMERGCDLHTADARFAARAGQVYHGVRVLGV